jgi:hypothetical protein
MKMIKHLFIILIILFTISYADSQLIYDPNQINCNIIKNLLDLVQYYIQFYWDQEYDIIRKELSQKYYQICL